MTQGNYRIRLVPHEHRIVVRQKNSQGQWGKATRWNIRGRSDLPKKMFFIVLNFIRQSLKECEDRNNYPSAKKAAVQALCEAGNAFGCEVSTVEAGADVLWRVKGTPLFAIQLHDRTVKVKRRNQLLGSEAIYRWTIAIKKGGYFRIKPRQTNLDLLTQKTV